MATLVGTEIEFKDAVVDLAKLDYDAIAAYEAAVERLEKPEFKEKLKEFMADHQRHTEELAALAAAYNVEPAEGPGGKKLITQGKVLLADLFGDKAILMAMQSNEEDAFTAYDRVLNRHDLPETARGVITRALADERRHRVWIEGAIAEMAA